MRLQTLTRPLLCPASRPPVRPFWLLSIFRPVLVCRPGMLITAQRVHPDLYAGWYPTPFMQTCHTTRYTFLPRLVHAAWLVVGPPFVGASPMRRWPMQP